jgi:hypothetical protein
MSSISEGLGQLIERIADNDRRHARRTGEYIDATRQVLHDAKEKAGSSSPVALPAASSSDFKGMTDADIKKLLRAYGVKGYTQRDGKKLVRRDRVQLAIDNKIPALSFGFLLDFYIKRQA